MIVIFKMSVVEAIDFEELEVGRKIAELLSLHAEQRNDSNGDFVLEIVLTRWN